MPVDEHYKILLEIDQLENSILKKELDFFEKKKKFKIFDVMKEREKISFLWTEYIKIAPFCTIGIVDEEEDWGLYYCNHEFIENCKHGFLTDFDGFGYLCCNDQITNLTVKPSYALYQNFDLFRFNGVFWVRG